MVIAKSDKISSSIFKLKIVSDLIKGEKIESAINQLEFCKKKGARKIKNILKSVISNAQNNYGYDIDKLYIKNVMINKKKSLKRSVIRARGKIDKINKYFSNITIILDKIKKWDKK
jgi:large subunit ribosomal protein L22